MVQVYGIVSGESIELAKAELEALLAFEGVQKKPEWYGNLMLIDTNQVVVEFILSRAALVKEAGTVINYFPKDNIDQLDGDYRILNQFRSFRIEIKEVTGKLSQHERQIAIGVLAERIKRETELIVNLDNPDLILILLVVNNGVLLAIKKESLLRRALRERNPGSKAFFHPSMMNAHLARVMCNLAGVSENGVVIDPFCGGGGILCEAAFIGAKVVGVDLNWRLLQGAHTNLEQMGANYALIQGDAQKIPVNQCLSIVTDPPYGRTSSTRGMEAGNLVIDMLSCVYDSVDVTGKICISGSASMNMAELVRNAGFVVERNISLRVHSGLTRQIIVACH